MLKKMALPTISNVDELKKIIQENPIVIIDVYATWCTPCRSIAPYFYKLADTFKTHIVSAKCNCDETLDVAQLLEVTSIPTFLRFENGQKVATSFGPDQKQLLELYMMNH